MQGTAELAGLLRAQRASLLDRWRDRVMAVDSARRLPAPALIDHLPTLIDTLIDVLERDGVERGDAVPSRGAPGHGVARLSDGYDPEEVVAELSILRESVLVLADQHGMRLSGHALRVFNIGVDHLMAEAVRAYVEATTATLKRHQERHLAFVAHDLRTPLGAISLSLAALERALPPHEGAPDAVVPRMLRSLHRNLGRLSRRVEAVLDSHGDGELQLRPTRLRLRALVVDLVRALGERASAADTLLVIDVPAEIELQADPALLGRALENLLVNAIESTPHGTVRIGAAVDGDRMTCWVQDDGEGIAPDRLDSLLDAAQSTQAPVGYRGLGLAIVHQFVKAHDGRISATSGDHGSTFRIELPAAAGADDAVNPRPPAAP